MIRSLERIKELYTGLCDTLERASEKVVVPSSIIFDEDGICHELDQSIKLLTAIKDAVPGDLECTSQLVSSCSQNYESIHQELLHGKQKILSTFRDIVHAISVCSERD